MKRYWQFAIVALICLLVALLWAQPEPVKNPAPPVAISAASQATPGTATAASTPEHTKAKSHNPQGNDDDPLPGSSSTLPLLAVIGFGVLAGGITSAMRSRERR
ncbi:MAG TPA: hypothetical protein VKT29_17480 [Terriglobales bacterium]|nr:hypothetical protein [Terriglobales bacterium]